LRREENPFFVTPGIPTDDDLAELLNSNINDEEVFRL